jgi:hypothetical protein
MAVPACVGHGCFMKLPVYGKWILGISGLIGVGVGAALLAAPVAFYAADGVVIGAQPGLLSDLRGTGASLLALGGLILAGAFVPALSRVASWVSPLLYLSYAVARVLAFALDGRPSQLVLTVMVVELALGILGLLVIWQTSRQPGEAV